MKYENNLKKLCQVKGLTLQKMSEETGLSIETFKKLSSGSSDIHKVNLETITKICLTLNCSIADLFVDRKDKAIYKKISK